MTMGLIFSESISSKVALLEHRPELLEVGRRSMRGMVRT
jgi:hypothetical protein